MNLLFFKKKSITFNIPAKLIKTCQNRECFAVNYTQKITQALLVLLLKLRMSVYLIPLVHKLTIVHILPLVHQLCISLSPHISIVHLLILVDKLCI